MVRGAGRDADWKEQTIRNTSEEQFNQEFECEFLGSVNTLITSSKLKTLVYEDPIKSNQGLDIFAGQSQSTHTV